MSPIRSLWILEPITLAFCTLSVAVLVLAYSVPGSTEFLALSPTLTLEKGYVWQLLTYALLPYSILSFLILSGLILWFGRYVERWLGAARYIALLMAAALACALTYVVLAPVSVPLVGALFVTSAVGVVFLVWSIANRAVFRWPLKLFWLVAAAWMLYTAIASPLYLSIVHLVAWALGGVTAALAIQGWRAMPSNPTPHSDAREAPGSAGDIAARAGGRER